MEETLAIVGGGAIATGLATIAAFHEPVTIWVRSDESAARTRKTVDRTCERHKPPVDPGRITVTTDLADLSHATAVIEAIAEDEVAKVELWGRLREVVADEALLGSTTSSLSVQTIAEASGSPERFVALHVFNPVPRMDLVELAFPQHLVAHAVSQ